MTSSKWLAFVIATFVTFGLWQSRRARPVHLRLVIAVALLVGYQAARFHAF